MKPTALLLAALASAAVLAGCAQSEHAQVCPVASGSCDGLAPAAAPWPKVDAATTLADLKQFSQAYPYRQSGTPTHLQARDDLAGRFAADGLTVVRQDFKSSFEQVPYSGRSEE